MVRRRTIAATTSALLATTLIVSACSSDDTKGDDDDDDNGGSAGTNPSGGKGGTSGGQGGSTAGTGTAGTTAGASGSATAGTAGTGGSTAGTAGTASGGTAGTAGASGSGGGTGGPFSCKAVPATCNAISDFPASGMCFGNGDFKGGTGQPYGEGLTLDQTGGALHVSGTVSTYSGFNLWFSYCSDLSAYTGISFTLSGVVGAAAPAANTLDFQLQTNSTFPWQTAQNMTDMKGGCTATDATNPYASCIAPLLNVPVPPADAPATVTVTWDQMAGGSPAPWSVAMSPKEIMGIQWQFPWSSTATAYDVDVTIDDVKFTGGTETACTNGSCSGSGGAGGAGGAGGGGTGGDAAGGTAGAGAGGGGAGGAAGAGMGGGGSGGASAGTGGGGTAGTAGATGGGGSGGGGAGGKGGTGGGGAGGKGGGGFGGAGKGGA